MKPLRYEVIDSQDHYVIRIAGNATAQGWIADSWGKSKADLVAIRRLVNQANSVLNAKAVPHE